MPFYNSVNSAANSVPAIKSAVKFFHDLYFSDLDGETEASMEEVEVVPWLLPNPKAQDGQFLQILWTNHLLMGNLILVWFME
ncbi:hypothetical protein DVH24_033932 [Malus domestica]|uniref:Uncharacterized protein n=1 Tax=Malus domestica TaxID=3750 RepID=A0A498KUA8_MALDO|nr:hypothetical protein DVH24_033932 [Malus domestica]